MDDDSDELPDSPMGPGRLRHRGKRKRTARVPYPFNRTQHRNAESPPRAPLPSDTESDTVEEPNRVQNLEVFYDTLTKNEVFALQIDGSHVAVPYVLLNTIHAGLYGNLMGLSIGYDEHGSYLYSPKDRTALKVFSYWLCNRKIPIRSRVTQKSDWALQLVYAWRLGGKVDLPGFQNLVMLEILKLSCQGHFRPVMIMDAVATTDRNCAMQKLMVVEAVNLVYERKTHRADGPWLDKVSEKPGFMILFADALREYEEIGQRCFEWFPNATQPDNERWKEFMLEGGPR